MRLFCCASHRYLIEKSLLFCFRERTIIASEIVTDSRAVTAVQVKTLLKLARWNLELGVGTVDGWVEALVGDGIAGTIEGEGVNWLVPRFKGSVADWLAGAGAKPG